MRTSETTAAPTTLDADSWQHHMREGRRILAADGNRPRHHVTAPSGWLNDPNGVIHWRGEYHLFFQYNPHAARWGPPYWGHVVSDDLVRWRDLPPALVPATTPYDGGGCWSGCAVDDDGTPTFLYTSVQGDHMGEQTTCLAVGDDSLTRWTKDPANPVVRAPDGLAITQNAYRDPYVWRDGDGWYQIVGTSIGDRGQALLYRSSDLRTWSFLHPLVPPELREGLEDDGHTWECPNFFPLGDKHVLLVSLSGDGLMYPVAFVGEFRDQRFHPQRMQRFDWGYRCFYAPLTTRDAGGRRLLWGWLQEQRSPKAQLRAGWSGALSLPRELWLDGATLRSRFVPELHGLRGAPQRVRDLDLDGGYTVGSFEGRSLELTLTLERARAERTSLTLAHAEDEQTVIAVDWARAELVIDRERSSRDPQAETTPQRAGLDGGSAVTLHLYLDGSVIEIIADGHVSLTTRIYPESAGGLALRLESGGGASRVVDLEVWELDAAGE